MWLHVSLWHMLIRSLSGFPCLITEVVVTFKLSAGCPTQSILIHTNTPTARAQLRCLSSLSLPPVACLSQLVSRSFTPPLSFRPPWPLITSSSINWSQARKERPAGEDGHRGLQIFPLDHPHDPADLKQSSRTPLISNRASVGLLAGKWAFIYSTLRIVPKMLTNLLVFISQVTEETPWDV